MKTWLLPVAAATLLSAAARGAEKPAVEGAEPGAWTMDFDAARRVAAEKKLPLLLNFTGSDWCGWCKQMDKAVFSQAGWTSYAKDNLLLVWLDFPRDKSLVPERYVARNKALSELFKIEGYPTYIVLDDDGKTQLGQLGADRDSTPESFIAKVKAVLENRASAVEALLKSMPEASAQQYRAADSALKQARAELTAAEDAFNKKSEELNAVIEAQEKRLAELRVATRLARLPKEKADAYAAKQARRQRVNDELQAWIKTDPPNNPENMKKFSAWRDELAALEKEMQALLDP